MLDKGNLRSKHFWHILLNLLSRLWTPGLWRKANDGQFGRKTHFIGLRVWIQIEWIFKLYPQKSIRTIHLKTLLVLRNKRNLATSSVGSQQHLTLMCFLFLEMLTGHDSRLTLLHFPPFLLSLLQGTLNVRLPQGSILGHLFISC